MYQAADQWKEFFFISADVANDISTLTIDADDANEVSRYNMNGQRIEGAQRSINIIRYSNGSTKKVIVK